MHAGSKQLWPDLLECSAPINSLYKGKNQLSIRKFTL